MAKYFTAQQGSTDLRLLPSWMRKAKDVADYAERMTAEIVSRFTLTDYDGPAYGWEVSGAHWVQSEGAYEGMVKLTDNLYVALRGYNVDPALADSFFADAFKREIAEAIIWRMQTERRGVGGATAADVDNKGVSNFRSREDQPFPPTFPRFLRPFIVEPVTWVI